MNPRAAGQVPGIVYCLSLTSLRMLLILEFPGLNDHLEGCFFILLLLLLFLEAARELYLLWRRNSTQLKNFFEDNQTINHLHLQVCLEEAGSQHLILSFFSIFLCPKTSEFSTMSYRPSGVTEILEEILTSVGKRLCQDSQTSFMFASPSMTGYPPIRVGVSGVHFVSNLVYSLWNAGVIKSVKEILSQIQFLIPLVVLIFLSF